MLRVAERHDVDLLVLERPGYGTSSRWPGRLIADVVGDVVLVADSCGWDSFAVWGGSGGGPHALACAALLSERVERCASVVGPAPFEAEGLDWFEGMSPGNVEELTLAAKGEKAYRPLVERLAREAVEAVREGALPLSDDYELPASDVAALRERLADPGYLERTIAANVHGVDGWIDDCIAMTSPWGIDLARGHGPCEHLVRTCRRTVSASSCGMAPGAYPWSRTSPAAQRPHPRRQRARRHLPMAGIPCGWLSTRSLGRHHKVTEFQGESFRIAESVRHRADFVLLY